MDARRIFSDPTLNLACLQTLMLRAEGLPLSALWHRNLRAELYGVYS